jgi:hypothetical protein
MNPYVIIGAVVAFAVSNGVSFSMGSKLGTAATEVHWQRKHAAEVEAKQVAEKKLSDALQSANTGLRESDRTAAQELQDKTLRIKDLEDEIEAQRKKVPPLPGCSGCLIDRRRVERVRSVSGTDSTGASRGVADSASRSRSSGSIGSSRKD